MPHPVQIYIFFGGGFWSYWANFIDTCYSDTTQLCFLNQRALGLKSLGSCFNKIHPSSTEKKSTLLVDYGPLVYQGHQSSLLLYPDCITHLGTVRMNVMFHTKKSISLENYKLDQVHQKQCNMQYNSRSTFIRLLLGLLLYQ